MVMQNLLGVQVPASVTGGASEVSTRDAAQSPHLPGLTSGRWAASLEDDIPNEACLAGDSEGGVKMRVKWVAGFSANAAVSLVAGLGLASWGFDSIPVSGLSLPGICGAVAGVVITLLALACTGGAIYAGLRAERLPAWWPSRSTLVLRGLSWVIGDLVTDVTLDRKVRAGATAPVLAGGAGADCWDGEVGGAGEAASTLDLVTPVAQFGTGAPFPVAAAEPQIQTRVEAAPKQGPAATFTRSGAPIIRVAIR